MIRAWALLAAFTVAVSLLGGCGSSSTAQGDAEAIRGLVAGTPDRAMSKKGFFAAAYDPPAKARQRMAALSFAVASGPSVSGDRATVQVQVRDREEKDLGQVEWTFVKEGGEWRLRDAPLP